MSTPNYTVIVPSHRPKMIEETLAHLKKEGVAATVLDGTGYKSFATLINHCVASSPTELVVVNNDKARPTAAQFEKTLSLLGEGYGFVGLYCFGFFGLHKETVRRVGFLDENFTGGGYEDCDFMRRCAEKDIAMYQSYEVDYLEIGTSWSGGNGAAYFHEKWDDATPDCLVCTRKLPDYFVQYDLGPSVGTKFKPWKESELGVSDWFKNVEVR